MDGRLGGGPMRIVNVYARLFARVVAADLGRDIQGQCRKLLADVREERKFFGTYFILSGQAPAAGEGV